MLGKRAEHGTHQLYACLWTEDIAGVAVSDCTFSPLPQQTPVGSFGTRSGHQSAGARRSLASRKPLSARCKGLSVNKVIRITERLILDVNTSLLFPVDPRFLKGNKVLLVVLRVLILWCRATDSGDLGGVHELRVSTPGCPVQDALELPLVCKRKASSIV